MKQVLLQFNRLIFLMLIPLSISAASLPDYYPESFSNIGTIDRIDIKHSEIVIGDSLEQLSMNAKVHSLNTEFSSVRTLRAGMKIGYIITTMNGNVVVAEIWILPSNYSSNHSE